MSTPMSIVRVINEPNIIKEVQIDHVFQRCLSILFVSFINFNQPEVYIFCTIRNISASKYI